MTSLLHYFSYFYLVLLLIGFTSCKKDACESIDCGLDRTCVEGACETITFEKIFDTGGVSGQQTTDGGYIVIGEWLDPERTPFDVFLQTESLAQIIKTDKLGNEQWQKVLEGKNFEHVFSVKQTADKGYIVVGQTKSSNDEETDIYLSKIDNNGQQLWWKTFGGEKNERGFSIQQTTDEGFIITGSSASFGNGKEDVYLLKTNSNGEELWSKTFGGTSHDRGNSVQQTTDGGFIITGLTQSFGNGAEDVYLIKTDGNGDELWSKTFGGGESDIGRSVQQTTDGGFIITGSYESFGNGTDNDVFLLKTDDNGEELWMKNLGQYKGNSVQETTDGGFVITGLTETFANLAGTADISLIKTDSNGEQLWSKALGGDKNDEGISVQQTTDEGFIITGKGEQVKLYLIKTDPNGNIN